MQQRRAAFTNRLSLVAERCHIGARPPLMHLEMVDLKDDALTTPLEIFVAQHIHDGFALGAAFRRRVQGALTLRHDRIAVQPQAREQQGQKYESSFHPPPLGTHCAAIASLAYRETSCETWTPSARRPPCNMAGTGYARSNPDDNPPLHRTL